MTTTIPGIATIADIARQRAVSHPTKVAITHAGRATTYEEFDALSSRLAQAMIGSGLKPGDRVGVLDRSSMFVVAAAVAASKSGLVFAGINWRLTVVELEYQVGDAAVDLLFVGPDYREIGQTLRDKLPCLREVVELEADLMPPASWLESWPATDPRRAVDPGQPAMLLYSSGTTGRPKGIMIGSQGLMHLLSGSERYGFHEDAVSLVNLPMFHIGGLGWALNGLYHACISVVVRDAGAEDLQQAIEEQGITNAFLVPTIVQMLLEAPSFSADRVASLRTVVYGGAPMPPELLRRALTSMPCDFAGSYGLTETTNGLTTLPPSQVRLDADATRLASVGLPHDGVTVRIVDPQSGADVPTGEQGEIRVRATQNMLGYWRRPDATANAFDDQGWLRTGDIGYLDADGYLYLSDRLADMVISGGENIYPAEVEAALTEHPRVAQAAVIGVPDDRWGETPIAFVVATEGAVGGLEEELVAHCRALLAGYKQPRSFAFVSSLPLTPTGKIAKNELRKIAEEK